MGNTKKRSRLWQGMAALSLGFMLAACASPQSGGDELGGDQGDDTAAPTQTLDEQVLGEWTSDEPGDPTLTFEEDGMLGGTDGCNGIGGEYTVEEDRIAVELGPSTLMACSGVDDWLRGVSSVTVDGDTMTVFDKDDAEVGRLQRS